MGFAPIFGNAEYIVEFSDAYFLWITFTANTTPAILATNPQLSASNPNFSAQNDKI